MARILQTDREILEMLGFEDDVVDRAVGIHENDGNTSCFIESPTKRPIETNESRPNETLLIDEELNDDLEKYPFFSSLSETICAVEPIIDSFENTDSPFTITIVNDNNNLTNEQNTTVTGSVNSDTDYIPQNENSSDSDQSLLDNEVKNVDLNENNTNMVLIETVDFGNMDEGRQRKSIGEPKSWVKNKNKKLRMEGKPYVGYSRSREGKVSNNTPREGRKVGQPCSSKTCEKSKLRLCTKITKNQQEEIFNTFWNNMNWDQRKVFISSHARFQATKRRTTDGNDSRRSGTLVYFLNNGKENLQVCRQMFINTLCIGYKTIQAWVKGSKFDMHSGTEQLNQIRKKSQKTPEREYVDTFLNSIPKLPSHYSRSSSSKLYLEPIIQSMQQLYSLYQAKCKEESKLAISRKTFSSIFYARNLSFHHAKKDKCDICCQYESGNLSEEKWIVHQSKKEQARKEKEKDKEEGSKGNCIVLTMDLQAVKLSPFLNANAIYYRTKLCCHNFTIYNLVNNQATCYWFTETDSDLTASTFTSCITDYLTRHCQSQKLPIIIYSDGCTYQNRNNILSNALLNFSILTEVPITQKYLERGHTQMECDSVHSCIERKLKNREIHLPSNYVSASREARNKPMPYEVIMLDYSFFKDYTTPNYLRYSSIRPGRKTNDPVVTDIRALLYNCDGTVSFKLNFDEDFVNLPVRPKIIPPVADYPTMHRTRLKISQQKWQHLQELKKVLPKDCHQYYDSLPH